MLLVQQCHFSNFFFLRNFSQENVFYDILEQVNAFLGLKKKEVHGLIHAFGPKMAIFPNFF